MRWGLVRRVASMFAVAVLAASAPSAVAQQIVSRPAVIGGQPTQIEQAPWQALIFPGPNALCGGALISATWVVTAAHCVQGVDPSTIQVFAGVTAISQRSAAAALPVAQVFVHPDVNASTYANDVALLQLAQPWTPTPARQAILLPFGQDPSFPSAGAAAVVSGWGQTAQQGPSSDQLQSAGVSVLADVAGVCGQYGALYSGAAHVCAGGPGGQVDTCNGDSGGPLVVDVNGTKVLAGITSVGNGCAQADYPGLYTRITTVLPWIDQIADIPTGPPAPPVAVSARALTNGRAAVTWQPATGTGGSGITTFTVVSEPGGASCATAENWCAVSGLQPGVPVAFTVQASDVAGVSGASAPSAPITAVHRTKKAGSAMRVSTVRDIAGVRAGRVRSLTRATCSVTTTTVRLRNPGLCTLAVGTGSRFYLAVS